MFVALDTLTALVMLFTKCYAFHTPRKVVAVLLYSHKMWYLTLREEYIHMF